MPESFFNKVAAWSLHFKTLAQVFSCEFCKISKNIFFHRTPGGCFWNELNKKINLSFSSFLKIKILVLISIIQRSGVKKFFLVTEFYFEKKFTLSKLQWLQIGSLYIVALCLVVFATLWFEKVIWAHFCLWLSRICCSKNSCHELLLFKKTK